MEPLVFDNIDKKIMSKKLELYDIQERELTKFKSNLTNREHSVGLMALIQIPKMKRLAFHKPRVLVPLLLQIYINDFLLAVRDFIMCPCVQIITVHATSPIHSRPKFMKKLL